MKLAKASLLLRTEPVVSLPCRFSGSPCALLRRVSHSQHYLIFYNALSFSFSVVGGPSSPRPDRILGLGSLVYSLFWLGSPLEDPVIFWASASKPTSFNCGVSVMTTT